MIERRPFGRSGHESSRVIFGAAGLGTMRQDRADQVLSLLVEHGVNHIDTAISYGESELRIAPWLATHPGRFFVATKTGERTGDAARASLERSLTRLGVDHVDLIQLHNLVEDDDWSVAHAPGGALEALVRARDEGLTRMIGVTGHGTRIAGMHLRSLERFDYDSVLLPFNFPMMNQPAYRHDVEALLEVCGERNVAVQTIKSVARRRWRDESEPHFAWYQPLEHPGAVRRAVHYVLAHENLFLNSTSDARVLPLVLDAAQVPGPKPSEAEMAGDVAAYDMAPLFDGAELERI